jgi:regulator of nucleoside diphosphate kinase
MNVSERKQATSLAVQNATSTSVQSHPWMIAPGDDFWRDPCAPGHPDSHDGYVPIRAREIPGTLRQPRRRSTIVVTATDARRLRALLRHQRVQGTGSLDAALRMGTLEAELQHATVVDARALPGNVITMNSRLVCEDEHTGVRSRLTLVYPTAARSQRGISVLAPLGTALLGRMVGQVVETRGARSAGMRLRITSLSYQPERAGDYHL